MTRGTVAFCDVVVNSCRAAAFAVTLLLRNRTGDDPSSASLPSFSVRDWIGLCVLITAGAFLGLWAGNQLAACVDQIRFKYILFCILGAGALMLASTGMTTTETAMLTAAEFGVAGALVYVVHSDATCSRHIGSRGVVVPQRYALVPTGSEEGGESIELTGSANLDELS